MMEMEHKHGKRDYPETIFDLPVVYAKASTFEGAFGALTTGDDCTFLSNLAAKELWDYSPLEVVLRYITELVRTRMADQVGPHNPENRECRVQVIPRGSFVSKTALHGHADLDIDLVIPDDFVIKVVDGISYQIGDFLGRDGEKIIFEQARLKEALQLVWSLLSDLSAGLPVWHDIVVANNWLELRRSADDFTRSIDARTKALITGIADEQVKLDIDLFIKIKTKGPGDVGNIIVGVEKDGPGGLRRYQETDYMPIEGKWLGDRVLEPVERCAVLMLKWWKTEGNLAIKSHHLLTALNALHELDPSDRFYLSRKTSERLSCLRVMEVMQKMLIYLCQAYLSRCDFLLSRMDATGDWAKPDYPFPQVRCSSRYSFYWLPDLRRDVLVVMGNTRYSIRSI
jgi:hypothetical protein